MSSKNNVILPINWFLILLSFRAEDFLLVFVVLFFFNLFLIDKNMKFPKAHKEQSILFVFGKTLLTLS